MENQRGAEPMAWKAAKSISWLSALLVAGFLLRATGASQTPAASAGSQLLAQVVDELWQHQLEEDPSLRIRYGLPVHELPRMGPSEVQHEAAFASWILGRLKPIQDSELSHDEVLTLELVRWLAQGEVEA